MKWSLIIISIFLLAFTIYSATAADLDCNMRTSCTAAETELLRLNNQSYNFSNAHAQLVNYTTPYPSTLCCNSTVVLGNSSTGTPFLYLWNVTNSHIQQANRTGFSLNYSYPAYFSQNESRPLCKTLAACPSIYTCLLSISNETNAHAGGCADPYALQVCCKTRALANLSILVNDTGTTFPISINVSGTTTSPGDSDIIYNLTLNGAFVTNPYIASLGAGSYTFIYNTTGDGENYTYAQANYSVTITKFNTSTILYLANTINFTGTYPANSSTQGFGCPAELTCTLYYDGNPVANPYYNLIAAGNHTFTYLTPGNGNYTSATITWYIGPINSSSTTIVTTGSSQTSGGGGSSPLFTGCNYYFANPTYYTGDTLILTFVCPGYLGHSFVAEWADNKTGLIYHTEMGTLQATNNVSYKVTKPMTGTVKIKVAGLELMTAKFVVLLAMVKDLQYLYMLGFGFLVIMGISLFGKIEDYEKRKRKNPQVKFVTSPGEAIAFSLGMVLTGGYWVYILYAAGYMGYIYMAIIGALLLGILYLLHKLFSQEALNKIEKALLIGITIVIGGVILYALSKEYAGYLQMGLVAAAVLGVVLLFNKLISEVR